jgi:hypothetical protein
MGTNTVKLHRVLRATPERVYRAFLDADAMVKWLPPNGFTGKVHQLDARVGGTYRMSFTNFSSGNGHSFGGEYLELVPNEPGRNPGSDSCRGLLPWLAGIAHTACAARRGGNPGVGSVRLRFNYG